jgi:alkanesulfonate monooxygenase SsuD/methylene tetrahydromethanopterin reductase-like flavin-dependent oxidoreductase (luciferase family)
MMKTVIPRVNPDPPAFVTKPFDFGFLTTKGPAVVGSPAEVAERLNTWSEVLSSDTNLIYIDMGGQPAGEYREMVELIGADVIPQLD